MDFDFVIKRHDRLPILKALLSDVNGPVNLLNCTVKFNYARMEGGPTVSRTAEITDPAAGEVQYQWVADDTLTPGIYYGEWEVTLSGKQITFPNDDFVKFKILEDVA